MRCFFCVVTSVTSIMVKPSFGHLYSMFSCTTTHIWLASFLQWIVLSQNCRRIFLRLSGFVPRLADRAVELPAGKQGSACCAASCRHFSISFVSESKWVSLLRRVAPHSGHPSFQYEMMVSACLFPVALKQLRQYMLPSLF